MLVGELPGTHERFVLKRAWETRVLPYTGVVLRSVQGARQRPLRGFRRIPVLGGRLGLPVPAEKLCV